MPSPQQPATKASSAPVFLPALIQDDSTSSPPEILGSFDVPSETPAADTIWYILALAAAAVFSTWVAIRLKKGNTNQRESGKEGGSCDGIKENLERKKFQLDRVTSELGMQEGLIGQLKQALEEKLSDQKEAFIDEVKDAAKEKVLTELGPGEFQEGVRSLEGIMETAVEAKETYESLREQFREAKRTAAALRMKRDGLTGEANALDAAYRACMLAASGSTVATRAKEFSGFVTADAPNQIKLFLDTDIGSEMTDAATLCLAATAPQIELLGVGTVTGDTVFRATVAQKFLAMIVRLSGAENRTSDERYPDGRTASVADGVPVAAGSRKASAEREYENEKSMLFPEGYAPFLAESRSAARLLLDTVHDHAGVTVLGIGPLSNIAQALERDRDLPKKVSRLIVMGGMIDPPLVEGHPVPMGFEYNFLKDMAAAAKVINAGFNLTILPGDVTFDERDPWTTEELAEIAAIDHPAARLLSSLMEYSLVSQREYLDGAGLPQAFARPWVNDELAVLYILAPRLFTVEDVHVSFDTSGTYPKVQVVERGYPVTLIRHVDFKAARRLILERLKVL
jgi:purine nucleosidase